MENDLHCPNLDDLDHSIIELLKQNGRITLQRRQRSAVNIPEATARYRVQRLLNSDLMQLQNLD
jgi:Lrp/AsnC family transcriptional regulator for asnA, asnC and gidA